MRRFFLLFLLLNGATFTGFGQAQRRLDSLLALTNNYHHEDSLKCAYYRAVFRQYGSMRNWPMYERYSDSALALASKLPGKISLSLVYYRMGGVFHMVDRLKAISYYNLGIEAAHAAGTAGRKREGETLLNLGALYMDLRDYPKSLEAHEKALNLFSQVNDLGSMSSCYMNLSYISSNMGQKVKAMEYTRKALAVFQQLGDGRAIAVAYQGIAALYLNASDRELSEMNVQPLARYREVAAAVDRGLKAALAGEDNSLISGFYRTLGQLNERQGKDSIALRYYLQAVATNKDAMEEDYGSNLAAAGRFYVSNYRNFDRGIPLMKRALSASEANSNVGAIEEALEALSAAYEQKRAYDSALYYYRRLIVVRNEQFNREKEQEITRRQLKIDFDIKEREYRNTQQLADARMKQQEQQILLRNQQLQLSDKENELQRLTFLQKQADLENSHKEQQAQLTQQALRATVDRQSRDQQIRLRDLRLAANTRISIFLAFFALVILTAAIIIFNSRKKTIRLNKVISEQKSELEDLVGVKDRIFSVVSHDLRGPVNNLVALNTLLGQDNISQEKLRLYMEQIKGTLDHTSGLMENLLNWAASQMKGFTPAVEKVNLGEAVQHALRGAEQQLVAKRIAVTNEVAHNLHITGDGNMVEIVVRNLISNAVKFSRNGGDLVLSTSNAANNVILSVRDTGVGMDASKVALINAGTTSAIQSTSGTSKEKGTGLGLMLSKHFVGLMKGELTVTSVPGEGSKFEVMLPAA